MSVSSLLCLGELLSPCASKAGSDQGGKEQAGLGVFSAALRALGGKELPPGSPESLEEPMQSLPKYPGTRHLPLHRLCRIQAPQKAKITRSLLPSRATSPLAPLPCIPQRVWEQLWVCFPPARGSVRKFARVICWVIYSGP